MNYRLYFDGSQKKSIIGCGFVIYKDEEIIFKGGGQHKDPALSNNVAEFISLIYGLSKCIELGIKELAVFGDSNSVIQIMNEDYRPKAISLKPCLAIARLLCNHFTKVSFTWIKRSENSLADRESR